MVFGLFKKSSQKPAYDGPPLDPSWVRNTRGKFHRLIHLDTKKDGLEGLSGVYVIWHSGVKPGWVYVGRADNLSVAIDDAAENEDITEYEINGGLYVTWSPVMKSKQNGVVRYLHDTMKPKVPNPAVASIKDGSIAVEVPGSKAS